MLSSRLLMEKGMTSTAVTMNPSDRTYESVPKGEFDPDERSELMHTKG